MSPLKVRPYSILPHIAFAQARLQHILKHAFLFSQTISYTSHEAGGLYLGNDWEGVLRRHKQKWESNNKVEFKQERITTRYSEQIWVIPKAEHIVSINRTTKCPEQSELELQFLHSIAIFFPSPIVHHPPAASLANVSRTGFACALLLQSDRFKSVSVWTASTKTRQERKTNIVHWSFVADKKFQTSNLFVADSNIIDSNIIDSNILKTIQTIQKLRKNWAPFGVEHLTHVTNRRRCEKKETHGKQGNKQEKRKIKPGKLLVGKTNWYLTSDSPEPGNQLSAFAQSYSSQGWDIGNFGARKSSKWSWTSYDKLINSELQSQLRQTSPEQSAFESKPSSWLAFSASDPWPRGKCKC